MERRLKKPFGANVSLIVGLGGRCAGPLGHPFRNGGIIPPAAGGEAGRQSAAVSLSGIASAKDSLLT